MADSVVNQILELMMQQGDIEAKSIREQAAWKEEIKRAKNAWKGNTLKALALIGSVAAQAIPGVGPLAATGLGRVVSAAAGAATGALGSNLVSSLRKNAGDPYAAISGTQPAGLGFNTFAGPMSKTDFSSQKQGDPYNPWDDEPI